ncbi:MAG TPA: beta-3-deoxy-D-manno-oct-2-ulosonic acid transferase, partial [Massilia sp.]|nr:beta-3-deoxy-D-manno-oct-2-ulosonic acid transferase [Massilia sp.]
MPGMRVPAQVRAIAGWGRRPSTARARALAARHGLPFIALEDGFLRSVGLGVAGAQPLSLVVDDFGIYYDATTPSRLEETRTGRE